MTDTVERVELVERIKQMKAERKRYFDVEGDGVDVLLTDCWNALEARSSYEGELREVLDELFEASRRHDPDDWDGEPAMIRAAELLRKPPFDKEP